jgi:DNA topoisomerase-3
MTKSLVLAEKPSVGRDIARVLKCNKKGNGYIEGEKYIVTWALGHLVTLASPEAYDDKYKAWKMEDLPMLPKDLKLEVIKQSGKQYSAVREQLNRKDVNEVIIATDAGREGELVARWIIEKAHVKKPLKRLWISSVTDKAILDGFKNLKSGKDYENLYASAVSRSEADWFVGLNVTRALTCKYNAQLSAGRVQTPTLAMIVEREEEIKNFKPKTYYSISGNAKGVKLQWQRKDGSLSTFNEEEAKMAADKVNGKTGEIVDVHESDKKTYAPGLYDLTELQRDANRMFGYSPKQTLSIMQRLYENHKLLTYPRTDSRFIPRDVVGTLSERLKAISIGQYSKFAAEILRSGIKTNKSFVDDTKVSDHHAIIPTEQRVSLSTLSSEELKIYDLVIKRFLSVMLPPYEFLQTTIKAEVNGENFIAKGNVIKAKGWKAVYDRGENFEDNEDLGEGIKEQTLPKFNRGDSLSLAGVTIHNGQTKPPARFNEATLLSAMENPQKYIKLKSEYAKTLNETGGLGTVATRADIIEKLYKTFYIEKKGKDIYPTSKGKQVIDLVPEDLKSPILTAKWEKDLEAISKGRLNSKTFIGNMRDYASKLVDDVKGSKDKFKHDNLTGTKCPQCGKYMLEVSGKNGKMLVCQDRDCGHRENVSRFTNVRCPECHKKLELRGEGDGRIYICTTCNFREKYSSFEKRFKDKGSKLNKKDVSNYMRKMKNENDQPMNSALAEALAKLKLDK